MNAIRLIIERHFVAFVVLLYLVKAALRVAVSPSLGWDESELTLHAQHAALGYGAQPPLYMWLQWAVFTVFGASLAALTLTKHVLMLAVHLSLYRCARLVGSSHAAAVWASLLLFAVPLFAYEASRDLSHSVIAFLCANGLLLAMLHLLVTERAAARDYLLVGLATAATLLTKYNSAILVVSLFGAALLVPGYRPRMIDRRMGLALAAAFVVLAPHASWMPGHFDRQLRGKLDSMGMTPGLDPSVLATVLTDVGVGVAAVVLPPVVFAAAWLWTPLASRDRPGPVTADAKRFLLASLVLAAVLFAVVLALLGGGRFRTRWLLPLMPALPLAVVLPLYSDRMSRLRRNGFAGTLLVLLVLQNILLVAPVLSPALKGKPTRLNLPVEAIAATLEREGLADGTLITDRHSIGGAIRFLNHPPLVVVPGMMLSENYADRGEGPAVFLWRPSDTDAVPARLLEAARDLGYRTRGPACTPPPGRLLEFPYTRWDGAPYRIQLASIPSRCRLGSGSSAH
mgnify:CR=1 FL=1